MAVEVTGKTFVVSFFQQGTTAPVHTLSFTKP